jgi:hypothetical protein
MTGTVMTRVVVFGAALACAACSNPSDESANGTGGANGGTGAGTAAGSVDATTGANVGATPSTTSTTAGDTTRSRADSASRTGTSGTRASGTQRPTKP